MTDRSRSVFFGCGVAVPQNTPQNYEPHLVRFASAGFGYRFRAMGVMSAGTTPRGSTFVVATDRNTVLVPFLPVARRL